MAEWKRGRPTQAGYWLRLNAGHTITVHRATYLDGKQLVTNWGWNEEGSKWLPVTHDKVVGWYWYGPIRKPPTVDAAWLPKRKARAAREAG